MSPGLVVGVVGGSLGPRPWSLPLRLFCVLSGWPVWLGVCCLCPSPFAPALCFSLLSLSCWGFFCPSVLAGAGVSYLASVMSFFICELFQLMDWCKRFFSDAVHVSRDFSVVYLRDLFSFDFNLICSSDRHVSMLKHLCSDVLEFGI